MTVSSKKNSGLQKNGIRSFPVNCFQVLESCGYRVLAYQELLQKNQELYNLCISYTGEAYTEGVSRTVAYNDTRPMGRINFSPAHELGHRGICHGCGKPLYNMPLGEHCVSCLPKNRDSFYARDSLPPKSRLRAYIQAGGSLFH